MHPPDRIRLATRHFRALQGFRGVALGFSILALAAFQPAPHPFMGREGRDITVPLLIVIGMVAANLSLARYYAERFGRVTAPARARHRDWLLSGTGIGAYAAFDWLQLRLDPAISLRALALAAFFVAGYLLSERIRWYYGLAAGLMLLLALLPLTGVLSAAVLLSDADRVGPAVLGTLLVICGLMDHRLLRALFTPTEGTLEQPA